MSKAALTRLSRWDLVRVLARAPRVYLGPDADEARKGRWGLLRGARRPGWVEVLDASSCAPPRVSGLAALRFSPKRGWSVVGLSLPEADWRRLQTRLLRELVPGDVVLTEKAARAHLGDRWSVARVSTDR